MKKKIISLIILSILLILALFAYNYSCRDFNKEIIGGWLVEAKAPFKAHLFIFHEDGTMLTSNPTNVQEDTAAPHGGTNDSVGMGSWKTEKIQGKYYIVGTFWELNAFVDNHQPTDTLKVTFKISIKKHGQYFEGPAVACLGKEKIPSYIIGKQRISINQNIINKL